jgi:peptidoglycan/LPS O-acetylase OafA/YrhL
MSNLQVERQLHIDFLRGIAAQLVLVGHAFSLLVDKNAILVVEGHLAMDWLNRALWKVVGVFVGRGADSVVVFFVLSGLLVGATVIRQIGAGKFQFKDYLLKRVTRLHTVIFPGLVISGLLIWISFKFGTGASVITANIPWYPENWPIQESMSTSTLFCNAAFLQTIFCSQYGHNSSLWSLTNEFHYYLAFPMVLIVLISAKHSAAVKLWCFFGFAAIVALWLYPYFARGEFYRSLNFFTGALIWTIGAFVPLLLQRLGKPFRSFLAHSLWGVVCCLLLVIYYKSSGYFRTVSVVTLTVWLLINAPLLNKVLGQSNLISRAVKLLSDFSFSLYVIHVPILFFFLSFSSKLLTKVPTSFGGLITFIGIVLITNLIAFAFYFGFERNYQMVLNRVKGSFGR